MTNRKISVVFVAYGCVPQQRIDDHFKWNRSVYDDPNVTVYMVTNDSQVIGGSTHRGHIRIVHFPEAELPLLNGKPVFSLTKTKNFGIKKAIDDGADVIICTDVDIGFSESAWEMMCEVELGQAIMPVYHLCADFNNRHSEPKRDKPIDEGMTGTTAMLAEHWKDVMYDEDYKAYGGDDGKILNDIKKAGIELIPPVRGYPAAPVVWHVDHTTDTVDNVPGAGRADCWGRAEGFNPDNFAENRKLHDRRKRRGRQ